MSQLNVKIFQYKSDFIFYERFRRLLFHCAVFKMKRTRDLSKLKKKKFRSLWRLKSYCFRFKFILRVRYMPLKFELTKSLTALRFRFYIFYFFVKILQPRSE